MLAKCLAHNKHSIIAILHGIHNSCFYKETGDNKLITNI